MPEGSAARKFLPAVDWRSRWPRIATWPGLRPEPTEAWRILCEAWPADAESIAYKHAYRALYDAGVSHSAACRRIQSLVAAGLARKEHRPSADPFAPPTAWLTLLDPEEVERPEPRWHRPKRRVRPGRVQRRLFDAEEPAILRIHCDGDAGATEAEDSPRPSIPESGEGGPGSAFCAQEAEPGPPSPEPDPVPLPSDRSPLDEGRAVVRAVLTALDAAPLPDTQSPRALGDDVEYGQSKKPMRNSSTDQESKIKDQTGDCALPMATVVVEALQRQIDRLKEEAEPAARIDRLRRRIAGAVPGLDPEGWLVRDLAHAVVFGFSGDRLPEAAIDATLRSFREQVDRARQGLRRPIERFDGLYAVIVADQLPRVWRFPWCPKGGHRQLE